MKKFMLGLSLVICLLGIGVFPVTARAYYFNLMASSTNVIINPDGTATLEYTFDFGNNSNASPLDAVDIGMPNDKYDINTVQADVDGQPVYDFEPSPYVDPGIAVNLGNLSIQPGKKGRVHVVVGKVSDMLHPATQQEAEKYASFKFSPTWFGSEYVYGETDMTVTLTLPPGIQSQEPRWITPDSNWPGTSEPLTGRDAQDRVFYQWHSPNASADSQYVFGATFPARLVPESAIVAAPLFNFNINPDDLCCGGFFVVFFGIMALIWGVAIVGSKKRKMQYLPPKIAIEGHGVKRGLTAVEAAVLMEQPPDRVFTMILFSVVKKGAASVLSREPLNIQITDPQPADLRVYEIEFLNAFKISFENKRKRELQNLMIDLIKNVTEKMKGFSRKETVEYYKSINEKAWQAIKAADTPEVQAKVIDEALDWSLMSEDYDKKARDAFSGRTVYMPMWWGHYDPVYRHNTAGLGGGFDMSSSAGGSKNISVSLPTLPGADFAASMVTGVQNFSSNVIGDLTGFTGAVTDKTNPVPVTRSSGGGGGGSCACACACAGCACACAGGGR
ncbi:MAG: hypothetical protein LWX83_13605 [Anaerolineae bacterium]|nr:hypothetical protein [Anaerolineae bacterium]